MSVVFCFFVFVMLVMFVVCVVGFDFKWFDIVIVVWFVCDVYLVM